MSGRPRLESLRPPASPQGLEAARAAARREMAYPVSAPWRRQAVRLTAVWLGAGALVAAVLGLLHQWAVVSLMVRAPTLAMLVVAQLLGGWAALAPGSRRAQVLSILLSVGAVVAVVALRGPGLPSALPPWICTLSHLGVDFLPVGVAVLALRQAAITPWRALATGLAAGAPGALVGELGCGQGALHVALYHLPAWGLALAVVLVLALQMRPISFAP